MWATTQQNVSLGVSDQAKHKPACSATEASMRLEILVTETRDITLSRQRTTKALICAFVVHIWHKTHFLMAWLMYIHHFHVNTINREHRTLRHEIFEHNAGRDAWSPLQSKRNPDLRKNWKTGISKIIDVIILKFEQSGFTIIEPPHNKTNKMACVPSTDRSACASAQSDQSSQCAQWVVKDPSFLHADSEDSDQTGRMPRLIWVFVGCTDQPGHPPSLIRVFDGCTDHFVGFVMRWLI